MICIKVSSHSGTFGRHTGIAQEVYSKGKLFLEMVTSI